jgi:hypothetical protein
MRTAPPQSAHTPLAPPPAQYIALRRLGAQPQYIALRRLGAQPQAQPQAHPHQTIKLNEIMFFYGKSR